MILFIVFAGEGRGLFPRGSDTPSRRQSNVVSTEWELAS